MLKGDPLESLQETAGSGEVWCDYGPRWTGAAALDNKDLAKATANTTATFTFSGG